MTAITLLLVIPAIFIVPALFMWLGNITCPDVFNLSEITYWQAFRLLIMAGPTWPLAQAHRPHRGLLSNCKEASYFRGAEFKQ